ncbi:MAG: CAAX amino protease family protein [Candidatus Woesebacteria bacterium GW2011_GWA1_37_7]|uniref:CAAX amino protease family protein n=1 Tax=Candidatus Woesebacteria bacterium GW2011_GWA1_37_7 TaxID=1618545 RepID=A0A0G0JL85_9BACT|nr:MAG: CAAX amino protease family protein [Candidatus Woesebacteria bacterium GW2011_GWA1_37_7]
MPKKEVVIQHITVLSAFILIIWGFYRMLFKLPEEIEEIIIKPIIWILPVYYLLKIEKAGLKSLGITSKNLFYSIYLSLGLGTFFVLEGLIINLIKYEGINFSANIGVNSLFLGLGLSFITAISEELAFRGYIFNRLLYVIGNEWKSNIITSIIWAAVHIPVAVFWWDLNFIGTFVYLLLTTIFGVGSAFVFARTKNISSSILLHVLWEWPIVLFR